MISISSGTNEFATSAPPRSSPSAECNCSAILADWFSKNEDKINPSPFFSLDAKNRCPFSFYLTCFFTATRCSTNLRLFLSCSSVEISFDLLCWLQGRSGSTLEDEHFVHCCICFCRICKINKSSILAL